jgi:putative oxidoreductase
MTTLHDRILPLTDRLAPQLGWLPLLAARLTVGWVFLQTGWGKLHNLEGVTEFFASLGIPAPELQAPLVAGIEFGGGILLLLGLATRFVALPLIGVMLVAIRTALWDDIDALSDLLGLAEFGYVVMLAGLVVFGAGAVSVDRLVRRRIVDRS